MAPGGSHRQKVGALTTLWAVVCCFTVCCEDVAAVRARRTADRGGEATNIEFKNLRGGDGRATTSRSDDQVQQKATEKAKVKAKAKAKAKAKNRIPWTLTMFPNPKLNLDRCGRGGKLSHICDPENLLYPSLLDIEDRQLQKIAKMPRHGNYFGPNNAGSPFAGAFPAAGLQEGRCKDEGVQVYVAVLDEIDVDYVGKFWNLDEAARSFAQSLGHQWGVLGTPCQNGVMLVYSVTDEYMFIQPDFALGDHGGPLPTEMLKHIVHNALRGVRILPNDALASAIQQLDSALTGNLTVHLLNVERFTVFLYVLVGVLGMTFSFLSLCCVYDAFGSWRHAARFSRCREKVKRVHELFTKRQACAEFPLCPICLDYLPSAKRKGSADDTSASGAAFTPEGPNVVRFLCGHKFHTDCVNDWFESHQSGVGRCPICELPHSMSTSSAAADEAPGNSQTGDRTRVCFADRQVPECRGGSDGEVKTFLLRSLREQHPDIVTEGNARRWEGCHVEIWLAELTNPSYQSIWHSEPEPEYL